MPRSQNEHHLAELRIALDPADPAHVNPPPVPPGEQILDIGCGAGQTLIACYPGRAAYGVDVDLDALKLGRTLTDQVAFACATAEALPLASASFGAVIARVSLLYTNIPRSFGEIRRVLKPDGFVWMTLHPFSMAWEWARRANWKGRVFFLYILLNSLLLHLGLRQIRFPGKGYESFQTERGIRLALRRAGFTEISIVKGKHFVVKAS